MGEGANTGSCCSLKTFCQHLYPLPLSYGWTCPEETQMNVKTPTAIEPKEVDPHPKLELNSDRAVRKSRWWLWLSAFAILGFGGYKLLEKQGPSQTPPTKLGSRSVPQDVPVA